MIDYADYRGYEFNAFQDWLVQAKYMEDEFELNRAWDRVTNQLDQGRPVWLGVPSHTQVVFGYAESADGGKWLATYNGRSTVSAMYGETENVLWERFDASMGIQYAVYLAPLEPPGDIIV